MNDERWTVVDRLLGAALEREPHERAAYLREACGDDEALRREVESLVAHASSGAGVVSTPAVSFADGIRSTGTSMMGRQVGPYVIGPRLGAGGMGEVYRARDTTLGRDVAIKILPRAFTSDLDRRGRLDREARLLAALNHPHIGAIYGLEELDGTPALVLELVEGDTLAERLAKGSLPIREALTIARQIADALDGAHEKGIVHRDLKPANIKITPDGIVKVLDFGLAKAASGDASGPDLTQSPTVTIGGTHDGTILGTAPYMSPEQARGKAIDKRTDVWAFACVLYEMLTGRVAFVGDTISDTIAAILGREPEWSALPAATPAPIRRLLRRCLDKDARRRLRDIGDVRAEIDDVLSGASAQAPRHYRMLLGAAVVMLAAAIAGGVYFVTSRAAGVRIESIAVLPFANGGNADIEYLSKGMASEILNTLFALEAADLTVVPWATVLRYAGKDPQEVGRMLGADAVVAGTMTQRSDSLDIYVELIDIRRAAQIRGWRYRPKLVDVQTAENQMARDVADQLRLDSSQGRRERLSRRDTNPQAHLLYLKGRHLAEKLTVGEALQAVQYFQQAITLDQDYVAAYAGLSSASVIVAIACGPSHESAAQARAAAGTALALDNSSAEAHYALGRVHQLDWKWADAERELKTAALLSPTLVDAHHYYSHILSALGRHEESLASTRRALDIDPRDPLMNAHSAWLDLHKGHFEAATAGATKSLELGETYFGHVYLGRAYAEAGRYADSLSEMRRARQMSPANPEALANIGYVYAKSGRAREARQILDEMDKLSTQCKIPLGLKAFVYVGLDQKDETFKSLEYAYGERAGFLRDLQIDERWAPLRADPRYTELVERIGLSGSPTSTGQAASIPR